MNTIVDIYGNSLTDSLDNARKYYIAVKIENCYQKFEFDTRAGYTLTPENQFRSLDIKKQLEPTNIVFRSYTENLFSPLGKVQVNVEYKGNISNEELYVILNGNDPLLGRIWVRYLKTYSDKIDQTEGVKLNTKLQQGEAVTFCSDSSKSHAKHLSYNKIL